VSAPKKPRTSPRRRSWPTITQRDRILAKFAAAQPNAIGAIAAAIAIVRSEAAVAAQQRIEHLEAALRHIVIVGARHAARRSDIAYVLATEARAALEAKQTSPDVPQREGAKT